MLIIAVVRLIVQGNETGNAIDLGSVIGGGIPANKWVSVNIITFTKL